MLLLYYPINKPLAPEDTQNNLFDLATNIKGVAFPCGSRSGLFLGWQGVGPYCYGTGDECGDPEDSSKGTHAYPYYHQVWAYDVLDLLDVRAGQKQQWEIQPYAVWRLNEMDSTGGAKISGAAYDIESGRLYITEAYGEQPAGHVYQVNITPLDRMVYVPFIHR
jgi:hypothetical protein